jgi:putative NADH-flavin reductase
VKLLIFGATGRTGLCLVQQALAQGHTVTAFARNPKRMRIQAERLSVLQGDVRDAGCVHRAVAGHDAVLCALGVGPWGGTVLSRGTRNIVNAMQAHAVRRLVCETSFGVAESRRRASILSRVYIALFIYFTYADKARQEKIIRETGLDWTIVRPAIWLTNGRRRGRYQTGADMKQDLGDFISRADVAEFMLQQLTDGAYQRQAVAICY